MGQGETDPVSVTPRGLHPLFGQRQHAGLCPLVFAGLVSLFAISPPPPPRPLSPSPYALSAHNAARRPWKQVVSSCHCNTSQSAITGRSPATRRVPANRHTDKQLTLDYHTDIILKGGGGGGGGEEACGWFIPLKQIARNALTLRLSTSQHYFINILKAPGGGWGAWGGGGGVMHPIGSL